MATTRDFVVKNGLTANTQITVGNTTVNAVTNSTSMTIGSTVVNTSVVSAGVGSFANVTTTTNVATFGTSTYLVANGNLGIGNTAPAHTLSVNGPGYFGGIVNVGANVSLTTNSVLLTDSGIASVTTGGMLRITNPGGGAFTTTNATETGYIKVTLPQSWSSTMIRMAIKVYLYATGESFDVVCGGYASVAAVWDKTFACILGDPAITSNYTVRFGHDGSKCAIYIGESGTAWSYPQIAVTDVEIGYTNVTESLWKNGWSVSITPTLGTITATRTNCVVGKYVANNIVWHAGNDGAGSGLDADLLDGKDWVAPGAIGSTTANTGRFTNVGIGTTNPTQLLDVYSDTADPIISLRNGGSVYYSALKMYAQGTLSAELLAAPSSALYTSTDLHIFRNNAQTTEYMRLNSSGNVGIGNAAPSHKLSVNGSGYFGANLTVATNVATFGTSTYLVANGNMGIGTSAPAHTLDVTGTIRHTDIITNAAGLKTYSVTTTSQGNVNTKYELMRISRDPTNWSIGVPYEIVVYGNYYGSSGATKWLLTYGYSDAGTLSCVDARGPKMFKVYLGTEVTVNANLSYLPVYIDIPNYYYVSVEVKFNTSVVTSITALSQVHFTGTYNVGTGALYSGDIHLVPSGGNTGIGNTAPAHKLSVNGTGYIGGNTRIISGTNPATAPTAAQLAIGEASDNSGYRLNIGYFDDGNYKSSIDSKAGGVGANLTLNASGGRVGIGTSEPNGVLTVFNSATFNPRTSGVNVHRPSSYGQYGSFAYDGDTTYFSSTYTGGGVGVTGAYSFVGYDSAGTAFDRVYISSSNGNVGFGMISPKTTSHINGNLTFGGNTVGAVHVGQLLALGTSSPVSVRQTFGTDGSGWQYRIAKDTGGTVTDLFTIGDNGNVGIDNTAPVHKLSVNGTGYFGGIITQSFSNGTTDYEHIQLTPTNHGAIQTTRLMIAKAASGNNWYLGLHNGLASTYAGDFQFITGSVTLPSVTTVGGGQVWHAGNDGAGSGLDADLLDGKDWVSPGAIGSTTANTGRFTNIIVGGTTAVVAADFRAGAVGVAYAASTLANMYSGLIVGAEQAVSNRFGFGINSGLFFQGGDGNDNFDFRAKTTDGTLGTVNVRITNDGNVGIGNTAPAHKLSVNGSTYHGGNVTSIGSIIDTPVTSLTANITVSETYAGKVCVFENNTNAVVVTVGTVTTAGFSTTLIRNGTNTVTIANGAGLTINKTVAANTLRVQYSSVTLVYTATNVITAIGDFG